jgi:hypothetical protein
MQQNQWLERVCCTLPGLDCDMLVNFATTPQLPA